MGGITGVAFFGSIIKNSSNNAINIVGEQYVGGIAGYSQAQIENSSNSKYSKINGTNYIGGIAGLNYIMGNITDSFNSGEITILNDNAGGIVGLNNGTIANCYNVGEIVLSENAGMKIGGICGQNLSESFINTSYNVGKIKNKNYAGGIVGVDFGTISNSFCLDTCLQNVTQDIQYNKTENDMKSTVISELGEAYKIDENNINSGYPILNWQ